MRRLVNECGTDDSKSDESNVLFIRVVKEKLGEWVVAIE